MFQSTMRYAIFICINYAPPTLDAKINKNYVLYIYPQLVFVQIFILNFALKNVKHTFFLQYYTDIFFWNSI